MSDSTQNQFVLGLVKQLYQPGHNLILSPYSLTSALVMLLAGTDGNSQAELVKAMFDEKDGSTHGDKHVKAFADVNSATLTKNAATLKIANLLYPHKSFPLKPDYVSTLSEQLQAIGKQLDFVDGKAEALKIINSDVQQATKGLIAKLLDDIDPTTRLILVNAIYFKGIWAKPFDKARTTENGDFYTSSGSVVKTALMHKRKEFPFYRDETTGVTAVQLDYQKEGNIAMVLILPREGVSIETYLKTQLNAVSLEHILQNLYSGFDVNLTLPRFKLNATHKLVQPLRQLGIGDIFEASKANLTRISTNSDQLCVSEILQKAVIEVNEEGTEAAAATAVAMMMCSLVFRQEADFIANRPFIFALVTKDTPKQVLFIGVVENPTKNE